MDLKKINSLNELFFFQYEKQKDKNKILLSSLKEPRKNYSWQQTFELINNLSDELKKYVIKGDRCLLISENRPEWFISDISIMKKLGLTPTIVHGGGKRINNKLKQLNIESTFIKGLRVTNKDTIKVVEDVLIEFNKEIDAFGEAYQI